MSESGKRRVFGRRANVSGGRRHAHLVKVSAEEEGVLVRMAEAQKVSVPRLLVESAMAVDQGAGETPTERKAAMAEMFALHRLLATISNNVNQIAKVTNATGEVQDDMALTLDLVRRTAQRIDAAIDGLALR